MMPSRLFAVRGGVRNLPFLKPKTLAPEASATVPLRLRKMQSLKPFLRASDFPAAPAT